MKENVWKVLAIIFLIISIAEFVVGYAIIKNNETANTIRIKELEMRVEQLGADPDDGGTIPEEFWQEK
jgi:hypothetical protein